jgi:hypothetical protein
MAQIFLGTDSVSSVIDKFSLYVRAESRSNVSIIRLSELSQSAL